MTRKKKALYRYKATQWILFSHKREGILSFADNMNDLEGIMLSGINLAQKEVPHDLFLYPLQVWSQNSQN
jgi:hypothetical protein